MEAKPLPFFCVLGSRERRSCVIHELFGGKSGGFDFLL